MSAAAGTANLSPVSPWRLLRHELRLSWRDFQAMMTAGETRRFPIAFGILIFVALVLHFPALAMVGRYAHVGIDPDVETLFSVSLIVALYLSLLLSQAMETVTRTLYSRGDLDLVLSSPVSPTRLFAMRIATNAILMALMAVALVSPFVDVLAVTGGWRWLGAYAVAYVDLDEGFRMLTNVVGVADPTKDIKIGQRVKVQFEKQDSGDYPIPVFTPI